MYGWGKTMNPFTALISFQVELIRQSVFMTMSMTESLMRDQQKLARGWSMVPFPSANEKGGACVPFRLR